MPWLPSLRLSTAIVAVVLAGCNFFGTSRAIVCDGVWPQWMLDAQDYDGSGCVEALPFDQAPEDADWTPINTGYGLCPDGEMFMDGECIAWPANRPWPPGFGYP